MSKNREEAAASFFMRPGNLSAGKQHLLKKTLTILWA